jgi:hypothetical protein
MGRKGVLEIQNSFFLGGLRALCGEQVWLNAEC